MTLATGQLGATGFAVDEENVYWTVGGLPSGAVVKVPVAGGPAITLATGPWTWPIALDDASVYWAQFDGSATYSSGTASIMRLSPK